MNAPLLNVDETIAELERLTETLREVQLRSAASPDVEYWTSPASRASAILAHRRRRRLTFEEYADLFGEPNYDILLDLYAQRAAGRLVSVQSACLASGVPPTTALRHISGLVERGLLIRTPCDRDRRKTYLDLTDTAIAAIERHLAA